MSDKITSTFLLEREQKINVSGHDITVFRTELTKSDLTHFELIAEVARDVAFINDLFQNPTMIRGVKLQCNYEGTEARAELSMFTKDETVLDHEKHVLHFVCSDIDSESPKGERYRFLLPHVHFGSADFFTVVENPDGSRSSSRDHLKFSIEGRDWTLRHLIEFENIFYTAEDAINVQRAAGVKRLHLEPSGNAVLEVNCDDLSQSKAMEIAGDICWLLHLALAQRVAWSELHVVSGANTQFVCKRSAAFPDKPSGANPIRNWCDGALNAYIEAAWPVMQGNPAWWRVSLNWFSIASENTALESSSMIYCMLFDRLSTHLLDGFQFPKQISNDLTACLDNKDRREDLALRLGQLLGDYTGNWTSERSNALVQQIELWNNAPSYPKKVAKAFELVDLKAPPGKVLQMRHKLMHEGGLKSQAEESLEFLFDLHQNIVVLMLAMLGYRGKFFSIGRGECQIADFLMEKPAKASPIGKSGCLGLLLLL